MTERAHGAQVVVDAGIAVALAALLGGAACSGDDRFRSTDALPGGQRALSLRTSDLQAGPAGPAMQVVNPYAGNPYAVEEGKRLFEWYNCAGCHGALGGGGIGPPLRDDDWIYGGSAGNIFQSVLQGRPAGMPAYEGRVPDEQVWKIVAFVQSLGSGTGAGPGGAGMEPGQAGGVRGTGGEGGEGGSSTNGSGSNNGGGGNPGSAGTR